MLQLRMTIPVGPVAFEVCRTPDPRNLLGLVGAVQLYAGLVLGELPFILGAPLSQNLLVFELRSPQIRRANWRRCW